MSDRNQDLGVPEPDSTSRSSQDQRIVLAHGEGGRLMRQLIEERIVARLGHARPKRLGDAAHLDGVASLAVTTDSYVVSPLFFPGGDIGSLSVYGTTNDLLVSGARPLYLTLSLILEEGFPMRDLERIIDSVAKAAGETQVRIEAGDTKVVPRGAADGIFINTTGVGEYIHPVPSGSTSLQDGDELVVSGPIGQHGIAVLCAREQLHFVPPPQSDSGSLRSPIEALQRSLGTNVRAMRDATRGGVSGVLHEWARDCDATLVIDAARVPVSSRVRGASELLGLDPLHIANEGTMLIAVKSGAGDDTVKVLRALPETRNATRVGKVTQRQTAPVVVTREFGPALPLDEPLGAPLPRIC